MKNAIFLLLVLTSILTAGLDFGGEYHYELNDKAKLRVTTLEKVLQKYGKPQERYDIKAGISEYVILRYYMTDVDFFTGKGRGSLLEFRDGVLIAYLFGSNYDKDTSIFDFEATNTIKVGQHLEEVIKKLGKPNGKSICPINAGHFRGFCKKGKYAYAWAYADRYGMMEESEMSIRAFLVSVDANGTVVEINKEKILAKDW